MTSSIVKTALIAIALLLSAGPSQADEQEVRKEKPAKASSQTKAPAKSTKAPANIKLVDINSATRDELKKLPGISDAEANKIIADRPFLTKAHLQTHNIVTPMVYQGLRHLVVARQKQAPATKAGKK